MEAKRVLLLGNDRHCDFLEAVQWMSGNTDLTIAPTIADGVARLASPPATDVTVIAQSEPGQFSLPEIERLHRASPLTRLITLLGSWCEGEVRTGRPWPGVLRIYWHQWRARMVPELAAERSRPFAVWQLPRTATMDEHLAVTVRTLPDPRQGRGVIAVHCQTVLTFHSLRDACHAGGYASVWYPPTQPAQASGITAAIWDSVSGDDCQASQLRAIVEQHAPAPVAVLLDFVRRQDRAMALDAGAQAILAKPLLIADLLWHLDAIIQAEQTTAATVQAA